AGLTAALITRRNAVADFDNAIGIRRRSKTAHSHHDPVDLVHDRETDFPGIGFRRGLKLCEEIRRSGKKEFAHAFGNAHAGELFVGGLILHQGEEMREPTINRPGLALAGFYTYFAEKRVQVFGAAENSYLKSLAPKVRLKRFRDLCAQKIPCIVVSRGFHLDPPLLAAAAEEKIAIFRTPMITMKFINAATIALEVDFSPTVRSEEHTSELQ